MNPAEFANIAKSEQTFWWYRGMNRILFRVLDKHAAHIGSVLEAGCGTGYLAKLLHERYGWKMFPVDLGMEGLRFGLAAIKNVGEAAMQAALEERLRRDAEERADRERREARDFGEYRRLLDQAERLQHQFFRLAARPTNPREQPRWEPPVDVFAGTGLNSHEVRITKRIAMIMPKIGARKMKSAVLITPQAMIDPKPAAATPAPTRPPTKAWLLLDGIPRNQVSRFQVIAPISAAKITAGVMIAGSMIPLPIVVATARPKKRKEMKLKKAAQATAIGGLSTRVETTVAIELAASWRPFRKSNSRATPIRATMAKV